MADRAVPDAFANDLTGVYATDPEYGANLIALMKLYNLYRFDVAAATRSAVAARAIAHRDPPRPPRRPPTAASAGSPAATPTAARVARPQPRPACRHRHGAAHGRAARAVGTGPPRAGARGRRTGPRARPAGGHRGAGGGARCGGRRGLGTPGSLARPVAARDGRYHRTAGCRARSPGAARHPRRERSAAWSPPPPSGTQSRFRTP